jgi:hypothetical protein
MVSETDKPSAYLCDQWVRQISPLDLTHSVLILKSYFKESKPRVYAEYLKLKIHSKHFDCNPVERHMNNFLNERFFPSNITHLNLIILLYMFPTITILTSPHVSLSEVFAPHR